MFFVTFEGVQQHSKFLARMLLSQVIIFFKSLLILFF